MHPGPVKLSDMFSILLNWRCHRIAFAADIKQMYRQMLIDPNDITYQRVFWRSDTSHEIKEYCINRLTFGTNFAPSFAIMGLHFLAGEEKVNYPNGAEIIRNDTYMDDTMSGNSSIELALRDQREIIGLLNSGGMELHKWASNAVELLEAVPETCREVNVQISSDESIKALGTFWNTTTDTFNFRVISDETKEKYTKRQVMSTTCKLFDPLGLISPVIARAKILMKEIWRSDCDWDEQINTELESKWLKYLFELRSLNNLQINRWIAFSPNYVSVQLHGFCDASFHAYGAVIYLRVVDESNQIHTSLVMSRSRVTPMSPLTIPRLELCGAVVLTELMQYVLQSIRHMQFNTSEIKFWTDSQTALQWIRSDPNRWQTFVSNRVAKVQRSSQIEQWNHVRTFDNPADLISRGASPEDLRTSIRFVVAWSKMVERK